MICRQPFLHQCNRSVLVLFSQSVPINSPLMSTFSTSVFTSRCMYLRVANPAASVPNGSPFSDAPRAVFWARISSYSDGSLDTFVKVENSTRGSGLTTENESKDLIVSGKENPAEGNHQNVFLRRLIKCPYLNREPAVA